MAIASSASVGHELSGREPSPPQRTSWMKALAPYQRPDAKRAVFQLVNTLGPFFVGFAIMVASLEISYALTLVLALPMSGLYIRLFLIQHDCGHGSFFGSRRLNHGLGSILGVITLTPFQYWRRAHGQHHASHGDLDHRELGDMTTLTVREYLALPWWQKIGYRLYRNLVIAMLLGPTYQFVLKHRFPWDAPSHWRREWASVAWTNLGIALTLFAVHRTFGLEAFLLVFAPIFVLAGAIGVWILYVQHHFEHTYWQPHEEWSYEEAALYGSSFYDLPPILHWFTANIGYHHIHHLASRIPNYRLRECFEAFPELHGINRIGFWDSLACARLKLWDEDEDKMVGFDALRELGSDPRRTGSEAAS